MTNGWGFKVMPGVRHAITNAEYHVETPDSVRVVLGDTWGRFDSHGNWLEGELRQADPEMCIWLTGQLYVQERARKAKAMGGDP
jgi:hypothetical protein